MNTEHNLSYQGILLIPESSFPEWWIHSPLMNKIRLIKHSIPGISFAGDWSLQRMNLILRSLHEAPRLCITTNRAFGSQILAQHLLSGTRGFTYPCLIVILCYRCVHKQTEYPSIHCRVEAQAILTHRTVTSVWQEGRRVRLEDSSEFCSITNYNVCSFSLQGPSIWCFSPTYQNPYLESFFIPRYNSFLIVHQEKIKDKCLHLSTSTCSP